MAYVILCKAARKVEASTVGFQVSNVSESVLPLQIKRSSFLDIAINLDCHTAITWSERAKPGLRWSLCHLSDITHLRAPEGNPDHVRLAIDGSGRGRVRGAESQSFSLRQNPKIAATWGKTQGLSSSPHAHTHARKLRKHSGSLARLLPGFFAHIKANLTSKVLSRIQKARLSSLALRGTCSTHQWPPIQVPLLCDSNHLLGGLASTTSEPMQSVRQDTGLLMPSQRSISPGTPASTAHL